MTAIALEDLARRLVTQVPGAAPASALPPIGAVLGVHTRDGTRVAAAGSASVGTDQPMTTGTWHDLASVTKVAGTTAAVMRLVSDGLLSLDQQAAGLLPTFGEGAKRDITVRDLLAHRSGMAAWWPLYLEARPGAAPRAAHAVVDALPLTDRPGSRHRYSDLGFVQLGRIVAAVTGLPLASAVRTLVHEPLGVDLRYGTEPGSPVAASALDDRVEREMIDSGIPYPVPFVSAGFAGWRTGLIQGQVHDGNAFHALDGVSGHAGLFGTVPQLLRLAVTLGRARQEPSLWAPEVLDVFFGAAEQAAGDGRQPWQQALGFRRYTLDLGGREVVALGHPGFVGAAMAFVPGAEVAVALGTNRLLHGGVPVPTELLLREVLRLALDPTAPSSFRPAPEPSRGMS
ncbi:serine hydrolase domain-containing protein [Actinotalea sp.]|uniref:serine hydrolase domain-containing protein n=1 Tax=Actinotalea sp. TaxID=1872145 RepID=UPI0035631B1A